MSSFKTRAVWGSSSSTLYYVPFIDTAESTSIAYELWEILPFGGTLNFRIRIRCTTNAGSTIVGVHRNTNTTPEATDTQTLNAGAPGTEFTISGVSGWSALDALSVSIDSTTGVGVAHLFMEVDNS